MDLKNIESTSQYAIKAWYNKLWDCIPPKYRIEPYTNDNINPFYDPELTFENRTQYKLTQKEYPKRADPWLIITWNTEQGVTRSTLTNRRIQTSYYTDDKGKKSTYKFTNAEMQLNFAMYSNSITACIAFQENYQLKIRDKDIAMANGHSVLGDFPVCLQESTMNLVKLPREKASICYIYYTCRIDYPILGYESDANIIESIDLEIDELKGNQHYSSDIIDSTTT